ncbi:unnamed protein product [Rotaria sp. Silwood2]|nr:unnamed protein product [Rotaria sp. Silwood2]CAF2850320.1 unnamed protein product [Rotaria sp. Silwood2]CAF3109712.1 unnamed protein product [Rotaria sp. Silwood2]CAF3263888.1 unnamed protein product [Rotaria sp. Silwood2]CAF3926256.1 unnamed protein product [Rotaria sp. Silwood2]
MSANCKVSRVVFQCQISFVYCESGTDLPDDDYTTYIPQPKSANVNNRNSSQIPIIIETNENDSISTKTQKSNKKPMDRRKTTITGISRRRPTIEYDRIERTRSAPPSPALNHNVTQRSSHNRISMHPIENETKGVSSERDSLIINDPNNSLSSGTLEVRFKFDAKNSKMWVFVIKATLEMTDNTPKQTLVQVHLTVLPSKRIRFRTRVKPIDNAMFAEEFFCKVLPDTMQSQGIRFRLYTYERFKREKLLAEATVMFAMINLDEDMCKIVPLKRAYPSQDSDLGSRSHLSINSYSRLNSIVQSGDGTINPLLSELEIGLAYDRNQSMLILEIGKGNNFHLTCEGRAPDTYVQIKLHNLAGDEITANRTATRYGQHQPVFAERYSFNIQENCLDQITLVISVINKNSTSKNDRELGWISFGHDASGNAQVAHWDSMVSAQGETITKWHTLLEK